ncbi:hypothetical protein [Mycoplasma todarodis]|uniref:Uncharacterized protein n=1 Tax=Mycoplasma todarodis TaxID=1937191 RepID=A0A4R0XQ13_9MOLU|nr:hypothetical protein [Mycoplasma todarodis]TCG10965.1 hypothetical protein C4B25_02655 [Mycoplasma todarodis]
MRKTLTRTKEKLKEIDIRPNWSKSKKNKILLGSFLFIILVTIVLKTIVTILWDTGYYEGKFHLWYWHDKDVNFILRESEWGEKPFPPNQSAQAREFAHRALAHPYFFWSLTQFTWQTTLLLTFVLCFRLFMYDDRAPKWLRWTHSQRTLSIVTMYDIIVCVVFWSAISKDFGKTNDSSDQLMDILIHTSTILVHAVIPACMVIYSFIYLILSTEASRLNRKFLFVGIIYPAAYIIFYLMISIIWRDPYPVSDLATTGNFKQLWIALGGVIGIFVGLAGMIYVHNWILFKFNKRYRYEYDYEVASDVEEKLEKLEWKVEKSKRKIAESKNETVIKKEEITLAKRKLAVTKAKATIKKRRIRGERYEKEYLEYIIKKKLEDRERAEKIKLTAETKSNKTPKKVNGKSKPSTSKTKARKK